MATVALSSMHFLTLSSGALDGFNSQLNFKKSGCVRANRLKISVSASQPLEQDLGLPANRL
jgi:hypothetical protein